MIDVYICEDVQKQRELFAHYVEMAIVVEEYEMELKMATDDTDAILEMVKESKNTGMYFLDIELGNGKNGLVLANEIRKYDPRGFIVFITSHSEMAFLTFQYKVEALDFIVKDDSENIKRHIRECMEQAVERMGHISKGGGKTLTIVRGGRKLTLKQSEIMYFETSANEHKLIVHTKQKSMEFWGKIKEIEQEAGEDFLRCHRSYLVNKKNVAFVDWSNKMIHMKNGSECPVSGRMLSHVKRQLK